jgi:hypothetical protein
MMYMNFKLHISSDQVLSQGQYLGFSSSASSIVPNIVYSFSSHCY